METEPENLGLATLTGRWGECRGGAHLGLWAGWGVVGKVECSGSFHGRILERNSGSAQCEISSCVPPLAHSSAQTCEMMHEDL